MALSDSHQGATYVMPGDAFYVSDQAGMIALQPMIGRIHAWPEAEAIVKFATAFTWERAVDYFENNRASPQIANSVPREFETFFTRGSQLVNAETVATELRERILRIDLRSHDGLLASVWFDVAKRTVTRTKFGR